MFRIKGQIGAGAFATAFLADQKGMDRQVVVKVAHPHLLSVDSAQAVRERFRREVRAASRVNHPNLATIYTAGETESGFPALVMEYIEGETLDVLLQRRGALPMAEVHVIFLQLAKALKAVHAKGIVHRDVSPGNVMTLIGEDPADTVTKLLDFGIAKLMDSASSTIGALGTPRYAAPEQLCGKSEPASDMFSMGALLYWALTGKEHLGELHTVGNILREQVTAVQGPNPCEVDSNISARVGELVARLMDPEPTRRPTAGQFINAWRNVAKLELGPSGHKPTHRLTNPALSATTDPAAVAAAKNALIIDLDADRAQTIAPLLEGWTSRSATSISRGMQIARNVPIGLIVVVEDPGGTLGSRVASTIRRSLGERPTVLALTHGRPSADWLRADVDLLLDQSQRDELPERVDEAFAWRSRCIAEAQAKREAAAKVAEEALRQAAVSAPAPARPPAPAKPTSIVRTSQSRRTRLRSASDQMKAMLNLENRAAIAELGRHVASDARAENSSYVELCANMLEASAYRDNFALVSAFVRELELALELAADDWTEAPATPEPQRTGDANVAAGA